MEETITEIHQFSDGTIARRTIKKKKKCNHSFKMLSEASERFVCTICGIYD